MRRPSSSSRVSSDTSSHLRSSETSGSAVTPAGCRPQSPASSSPRSPATSPAQYLAKSDREHAHRKASQRRESLPRTKHSSEEAEVRKAVAAIVAAGIAAALLGWVGASASPSDHRQERTLRLLVIDGWSVDNDPSGQSGGDLFGSSGEIAPSWTQAGQVVERVYLVAPRRWTMPSHADLAASASNTARRQHSDSGGPQPARDRRWHREVPQGPGGCDPACGGQPGHGPAPAPDDSALGPQGIPAARRLRGRRCPRG